MHGLVGARARRRGRHIDRRHAARQGSPRVVSGTSTNARCEMRGCGRVSAGSSVSTPSTRSISTSSVRGPKRRSLTRPAAVSIAWQADSRSPAPGRSRGSDLVEKRRLVGQVLRLGLVDRRDADARSSRAGRERVARRARYGLAVAEVRAEREEGAAKARPGRPAPSAPAASRRPGHSAVPGRKRATPQARQGHLDAAASRDLDVHRRRRLAHDDRQLGGAATRPDAVGDDRGEALDAGGTPARTPPPHEIGDSAA